MRPADTGQTRLSAHQSDFPKEFANFVAFVGAEQVHSAVAKVMSKLDRFDPPTRRLFGTRYFFHEELTRFANSAAAPFQLDIVSPLAIRAAGFIATTNRARLEMGNAEANRLKNMIIDNLKPDRDFRQIEHEFRCYTHFRQKGFVVHFADLKESGKYDLLCARGQVRIEVECKTVSEDTGNPIKAETLATLAQLFSRTVKRTATLDPGLYTIKFKSEPKASNALSEALKIAVRTSLRSMECGDATIAFLPRPHWRGLASSLPHESIKAMVVRDPNITAQHCITKSGSNLVGLTLATERNNQLTNRITDVIKSAADQLSGTLPSLIWLHLVGLPEQDLLSIAKLSMDGRGGGFNAMVSNALSPSSSPTDRKHVNGVVYSAEAEGITRRPAFDKRGLLSTAASISGSVYLVPIPFARFSMPEDII